MNKNLFKNSLARIYSNRAKKKDFRIVLKTIDFQIRTGKKIEQEMKSRNLTFKECYYLNTKEHLKECEIRLTVKDFKKYKQDIILRKHLSKQRKRK